MIEIFDKLEAYLRFDFVRNALRVGVLIALCSSLLGVTLVLKRFSFIGDGLSHVAFGAMSVAAVVGLTKYFNSIIQEQGKYIRNRDEIISFEYIKSSVSILDVNHKTINIICYCSCSCSIF